MRTTHRLPAATLTAALLLSLTACGGSDSSDGESSSSTRSETTATPPPVAETSEAPDAAAAEPTKIAVDETITDDVMGDTIKITGLVRDFVAPSKPNIPDGGGEWVLIEVEATAGTKYYGSIAGTFSLYETQGDLAGSPTSVFDADMVAAGYTPFDEPDSGKTTKGWIPFQVNTRADAYQMHYKRLSYGVSGGGEPIPEKIWTIDLPTT